VTARTVLVYYPDAPMARAFADFVRLPDASTSLHVASTPEEATPLVGETDVLYGWKFPPELLGRASRLRWIQAMGAGVERFLVPELTPSVVLTRVTGVFGPWMAEYTVGWCLWVTQRIHLFQREQQARRWTAVDPLRLHGAVLCVVGLGDIGRPIARAARRMGMRVIGVTRRGRPVAGVEKVHDLSGLKTALGAADFVALVVPLSPETTGLIGEEELAAMKPSAWLINMARGPVVEEGALIRALAERRIGGAVLDVFDTEPLPAEHPLWTMDNVAVTPHISGPSDPAEIAPFFNDNLRRFVEGRPLRGVVNRARGY
jgi:glyoxylate/hydroxypyruvate reductase A